VTFDAIRALCGVCATAMLIEIVERVIFDSQFSRLCRGNAGKNALGDGEGRLALTIRALKEEQLKDDHSKGENCAELEGTSESGENVLLSQLIVYPCSLARRTSGAINPGVPLVW
jgi:hypothetical protein